MHLYKGLFGLLMLVATSTATPTAIAGIVPHGRTVTAATALPYRKCDPNANYAFTVDQLNVDPLPIRGGAPLSALLNGQVNSPIPKGSKVRITAKVGLFTKSFDADLCNAATAVNLSCPITPGPLTLSVSADIPRLPISNINAKLTVSGKAPDGSELFCFNTDVSIS
ncbi:ML domain-containing protein [Syncephalis fuscata]|nr:ML domain-containing protein [Syncephalis fuscata]